MGPMWRNLRTDRSVVNNRLDSSTVRRVLAFARPHRKLIAAFLALTVVDACMVVVTPLLVQRIVDDGILKGDHQLVTLLALGMAGVAVFGAVLAVCSGYLSSRIGEGLIYDLRTQVFAHVQRQSLAFFTRTQTGALVSRLKESREHVRTVVKGLQDPGKATRQYGRDVPQWSVLLQLVAHMNEHLGQSIAYARMNGVVPPWSR